MTKLKYTFIALITMLCALTLTSCMDLYDDYEVRTITFMGNGGKTENGLTSYTQTCTHGEVKPLKKCDFTNDGKIFLGWAEADYATEAVYTDGANYTFNSDKKLYAVWVAGEFTVTFEGNGGETTDGETSYTQNFTYGISQKLISNKFSYEGKGFAGWALTEDATTVVYPNENTLSIDSDITLYAVWKNIYTVTFHPNGHDQTITGSMTDQKFTEGVEQALEANQYICGNYDFSGWATTAVPIGGDHEYENLQKITLTSDMDLYAVWVAGNRDLYVSSEEGSSDYNPGTEDKPFEHLQAAISRINANYDEENPWTVYIVGTVEGNTEISAFNTNTLTIKKSGSDPAVLSCSDSTKPVLSITEKCSITLENISIENGSFADGSALFIKHNNANIVLDSSSVTGNSASGSNVYIEAGTLTLNATEISGNTGTGVKIANGGTLVMNESSSISNNTGAADGGGVYIDGGTFTMNGGSISSNTVTGKGGGVYVTAGTLTISGGTVAHNTADNGGGIYNAGKLTIDAGSIESNTATTNGGGIYNSNEVIMSSGVIKDNRADNEDETSRGGGVYNDSNATFEMKGDALIGAAQTSSASSTDCSNYAVKEGGGIYNAGTLTIGLENNTDAICYNYSKDGGGIYNKGTVSGSTSRVTYNGSTSSNESKKNVLNDGGTLPD